MTMTRQQLREEYAALLLRGGMTADKVLTMVLGLDRELDGIQPQLALPAPAKNADRGLSPAAKRQAAANPVRRPRKAASKRATAAAKPKGPKVSAAAAAEKPGLRRWTPQDDDQLLRLADQGKTNRQIADQLDRTESAVGVRLSVKRKELNVPAPRRRKVRSTPSAPSATLPSADLSIDDQITGQYRNCLSCGAAFLSTGAGRRCPDCKR